jgi:hypothetical protein
MFEKITKVLIVAILGLIIGSTPTLAQTGVNLNYAFSNELGVDISPTYPRPNENVSISLSLYTGDLNSADITWYKDGKKELSGKGETKYSFVAGTAGKESKIEIDIKLLNGISFSKIFTVSPASVNIVWEADSYVPPFYKGKALHPRQGTLKIVALPEFIKNNTKISPEKLVYKWSNAASVYQSQSGYGKNILVIDGSVLGKREAVTVLVTDPSSNMTAESSIFITPTDPQIVFYQNDSYYGYLFDLTVPNPLELKTEEVQILAAPYYFTKDKSLKYNWRLNNQAVPNLSGSMTAIFKKPDEITSGSSNISLEITNSTRILQQASKSLIINFND